MLGVVLWSDSSDQKAVIWCEDQGDLAFWSNDADTSMSNAFPFDAGDLVQFDVITKANVRKASNPQLVIEQVGRGLPQALRERSKCQDAVAASSYSNVVPFKRRGDDCCSHLPPLICIHS